MSHYMTALAMQQIGLKPATKIVLYWIADHYNHETHRCFPSHKRLAHLCEMSRQSVINHIAILQEQGMIRATNRTRDNGSNTSCEYELLFKQADIQNLDTPSTEFVHGDVNLFDHHNLVNNNPVTKPSNMIANASDEEIAFEIFWQSYPKKTGKQTAKKAYFKALKATQQGKLINACYAYAKLCKEEDRPKKYILNPATWLNGGHWDDEEVRFKETPQTSTEYLEGLLSGHVLLGYQE